MVDEEVVARGMANPELLRAAAQAHLDKQMVVHELSYDAPKAPMGEILGTKANPAKKPVLCDYCNWCAHSTYYEARVQRDVVWIQNTGLVLRKRK
jgi:hypothetical protein